MSGTHNCGKCLEHKVDWPCPSCFPYHALKAKSDKLLAAADKSIDEFQWVTNGIQMNENQHVRLGNAICALHDAIADFKAEPFSIARDEEL